MAAATVPEYRTLIPAFDRVDPGDAQVGRPHHQLADRQLDAVRRASLDHPAQGRAIVIIHLLDDQRGQERDRMPHAALLHGRGDHGHRSQPLQFLAQGSQPRGKHAVVVGQQDLHDVRTD